MNVRIFHRKRALCTVLLILLLNAVGLTKLHAQNGVLNGVFSVDEDTQVYFSQGNLQYQASTNTWRFAEHQWDFVGGTDFEANFGNVTGSSNNDIGPEYSGWIDLFGWGTSGYEHGAVCYQPWSTCLNNSDYFAYGSPTYNLNDSTGQADWGYNAISNGGDSTVHWRTLSQAEWHYLLFERTTVSDTRYVLATVNGVDGLILLPDTWDNSIYSLYGGISINSTIWTNSLEPNGAVFLPAAGERYPEDWGDDYYWWRYVNWGSGQYWAASHFNDNNAYYTLLDFWDYEVRDNTIAGRLCGLSVRLVQTIIPTSYSISTFASPIEGGVVTGSGEYVPNGTCTVTAIPYEGYSFVSWVEKGEVVSTDAAYTFEVTKNRNLTAHFSNGETGLLNGVFSISNTAQVSFSKGNLQYIGSETMPYWKFADNQWGYFGTTTEQNSNGKNVDRDLFGWGTSGYNHGAVCYQPWSTEQNSSNYYAYGNWQNNLYDQTGKADWGYNAIINGGNQVNSGWRMLTSDEWNYLFSTRNTISGIRWASGRVNGVNGVILLPDNWTTSIYGLNNVNGGNYNDNIITAEEWTNTLEANGAVFLPASGHRIGTSVSYVNNYGVYWSSTYGSSSYARNIWFYSSYMNLQDNYQRYYGRSVRLVQTIQATSYIISASSNPEIGGSVTGIGSYGIGETCTLTATPSYGYAFANWTKDGIEVSTDSIYSFIVTENADYVANFTQLLFEISASASPNIGGTTTGSGNYWVNDTCTLVAIPNADYVFVNWRDGSVIVSTDSIYTFQVTGNRHLTACFTNPSIEGILDGVFSINDSTQVFFSKGNLQYQASTNTWRFAEDQMNYVGTANSNISPTYSGWIDLFGWATSGFDHGAVCYQPWSTDQYPYGDRYNAYGDCMYNLSDQSGQADWGYNAISNGGNQTGKWRTLSFDEWYYLLYTRNTPSGIRYAGANIDGAYGYIILPDDWDASTYAFATSIWIQDEYSIYNANTMTLSDWKNIIEPTGAVFLPAAGYRSGTSVSSYSMGIEGSYWTSTSFIQDGSCDYDAHYVNISGWEGPLSWYPDMVYASATYAGHSVRLVQPIQSSSYHVQVTDTTATACDEFIWHGQSYSSSGVYYDTLSGYLGIDSLIALHLTINPSYHNTIYITECDSYYWEDSLYTESGQYMREYQTIHECDSVLTLNLTINPTRPLGNFTYLTPANDYICRYADIDFAWDTVTNTNSYDFYFWQGEGERPEMPLVANLISPTYHIDGLIHGENYHWCVLAKNECGEQESPIRSFTCLLIPTLTVLPVETLDFGEIELGQSRTKTIAVSATALPENISYSFLDNAFGQDSEFFNITPSTNWNSANGGSLQVTFTPDATHLYYNTALRIVSGTLADTIYLTGSLANRFVFSTNVEESVYTANDEITITGHVEDILGNAVSNLDVDVYLIVMGSRITLPTVSDANGDYSVVYSPRYSEAGYYKVGSCEKGKYANAEHDAFDIPGMGRVSGDFIVWQVPQNNTLTGSISIRNRSSIPLGNIQVTPISLPYGCTVDFIGTSLGSLETGELQYSVSGTELSTGSSYEEATFLISSDAGITMNLTCYYYCYRGRGELDVYPYSIATTMTRNRQKMLSFQITNNGEGETGPITIGLPNVEWMSVMGGNTLESVPVGDSCAFTISLTPDNNVSLNQYSGTIAVNCANGNGFAIPYQLEATSDSTGTLVVDVTDDYTYNTNDGNGPHLAGANVNITGFYSLETIAQGVTGEDGHFVVEDIPEGYYYLTVQARNHKEYNRHIIYIEGGKMHWKDVYLQFQAISYSWNVVPTEIQDEYEFELVCNFKTNVPVPVVILECPQVLDTLAYGDSLQFDITLSNYGLIDAYEAQINVPTEFEEYDFYPLYDIIDTLHAKSSVVVPCTMKRIQSNRASGGNPCTPGYMDAVVWYHCNQNREWVRHELPIWIGPECSPRHREPWRPRPNDDDPPYPEPIIFYDSIYPGPYPPVIDTPRIVFPPIRPPREVDPYHDHDEVVTTSDEDCTPCWKVAASTALHIAAYKFKPLGVAVPFVDCIIYDYSASDVQNINRLKTLLKNFVNNPTSAQNLHDFVESNFDMNTELLQCMRNVVHEVVSNAFDLTNPEEEGQLSKTLTLTSEVLNFVDRLRQCVFIQDDTREEQELSVYIEQLEQTANYSQTFLNELTNLFQEEEWEHEDNLMEFYSNFSSIVDTTTRMVSPQATQQLIATSEMSYVSDSIIQRFVDRWNRSVQYWNDGIFTYTDLPEGYDSNFIPLDTLMFSPAIEALETAEAYGYDGIQDMFASSITSIVNVAREHTNDVCSKVSISFKQTMTMTREAFDGTLKIYNGHTTDAMENIDVDIVIKDADGVNKTDLFQINVVSLDQISGIDGSGILDAQNEGIVQFQMIPTIGAAPDSAVIYSFGGSFTFLDPFSGETMTYQLYPVELTVNPSPNLYVDYFVQRNIISDDPLTDTIETAEPAEIAMMIRNVGAGDANNVYLESSQPTIVENENGLSIIFPDMVGAAMNGEQRPLGLTNIPFGTIQSHTAGIAEWYFTSSLMGRIIHSTPHVIHNNSYGNPNLSLVTELNSHELIKAIRAYGSLDDGINDFFVNETIDFNHTPDKIYFSHGGTANVKKVLVANTEGVVSNENSTILLNINPIAVGWNYACVNDPGQGVYEIISCTRSDGQEIPLNNVWVTHVTMFDDDAPVHENKLHIVDTVATAQTTTYTIIYANEPSNLRIFHGNEDDYWSNAANWEGYILPQADDEVLIDGICQLDQDAEVFSLTVAENQSLTIPEDRILTVSGMLTSASVSRLIIEEGGQLFHGNTGVQATVQKTIMPYTEGENDGWYFIASPLSGSTSVTSVTNMLDNEYDLYYYDEPTAYWMNQEYAPNGFSELVNGKGYLYANSDEVLLGFAGELQSGSSTVTVFLNYTEGGDLQGFNLVGNPFVYNLTSYASVNVANGCYQLNEAKDDLIVNEISEENPLKPAEGFFVKATDEGASITFNPGRGETANRSGSIRVELSDHGKLIDRLIVKMEGEPLEKMSLKEQRTKVFATQNHQEIAIVPCEGDEQPVSFKAAKDGTYTINVNTNGLEFNYLHLIDNLTGVDVDLLVPEPVEGPASYTFEAKTTDYASRFRLVFSVCGNADGDDAPFAFINNGDIIIIGAEAGAVLQIVDVLGHVVRSGDAMNRVSTGGMTKGVYVLRLINGDDVRTQKIIID